MSYKRALELTSLLYAISLVLSAADPKDTAFAYTSPDLIVSYTHQNIAYQLEAFKSTTNDKILVEKDANKYAQLLWASLGHPLLVKIQTNSNKSQLFHFSAERFYTHVSMLSDQHKQLFVDHVRHEYNVNVSVEQIVSLPIAEFRCRLKVVSSGGKKAVFIGKVSDLNRNPFQLEFLVPSEVINSLKCLFL